MTSDYLFATSRYYLLLLISFRGASFDVDMTRQGALP